MHHPYPHADSRHRGTIIKAPDNTPGLLMVGGAQYAFELRGVWRSPIAPAPNQAVAVELDTSGGVVSVEVVDTRQLAQERFGVFSQAAQQHGQVATQLAKQGFDRALQHYGRVTFAAIVLLWVACFLCPVVRFTFGATYAWTFWEVLGLNLGSQGMDLAAIDHGLFAWLGLAAFAAPLATAWLRRPEAVWLLAAPAAFILLTIAKLGWAVRSSLKQVEAAGAMFGAGLGEASANAARGAMSFFSIEYGAYALMLAAGVLAAQAISRARATFPLAARDAHARPVLLGQLGARIPAPIRRAAPGKLLAAAGAVVAAMVAWSFASDGFFERSLSRGLDDELQKRPKTCWALQNMNAQFPLRVNTLPGAQPDPILVGLAKGGYIKLTQAPDANSLGIFGGARRVTTVELTDRGRDAGVWDAKDGFCLGRRRVQDVVNFTEPAPQASGVEVSRVVYTWMLGDRPSWAEETLFAGVPGMSKPVEGSAIMHKTTDGWRVAF